MNEFLIQHILPFIEVAKVWGPLLIIIFMTIESSAIPFPSEVVMIPAGFMAARGELCGMDPIVAATVAVICGGIGSLLGAHANYWLALKLGRPFLHKYGKYFFLPPEALDRAEEVFREYGTGATFVCRLMPAIRQLISIPAGLARMNVWSFTFWTAAGATLWCIVLTVMGYWFGAHTREMGYPELVHHCTDLLGRHKLAIMAGCILALAGYVWLHRRIMQGGKKPAA